MTPKQLSKMSDEEINKAVAGMMGWRYVEYGHLYAPFCHSGNPPGDSDRREPIPSPTTNASDDYAFRQWVMENWKGEQREGFEGWLANIHHRRRLEVGIGSTGLFYLGALYIIGDYAKAALLAKGE